MPPYQLFTNNITKSMPIIPTKHQPRETDLIMWILVDMFLIATYAFADSLLTYGISVRVFFFFIFSTTFTTVTIS